MLYTYKWIQQAGGLGNCGYLEFAFDRQLSHRTLYRDNGFRESAKKEELELMDAVANTKGVIKGCLRVTSSGGLVKLEGNELLAQVHVLQASDAVRTANNIVKKVQRRLAKGEPRRRIKKADLDEQVKKLNARTWGT